MRFLAVLSLCTSVFSAPVLLDNQFDLPRGFHIYRAAGPDLAGGSYDITFDGEGRLLIGDGNAVRRLKDTNNDGLFDGFDLIASGLGPRGPQGLLVWGDRLYAVGGDGIQLYEGYSSGGPLRHKGRLGNKFQTGGDHDAHTIFRGHDGYLYFMAGNGAGISTRAHITEPTSPALNEREASVFRISPDGAKWECLASGGRNPPNLGMNFLGDLFSFDSDMEWHVALPWYRPVRLNHWITGADLGWQEVGAYPPYYIDSIPGILDIGRGSPTWGTFYEHDQFPEKYRNAYLVCDYRWKRESDDQYATTGRLVAFFLKRNGASWTATMETLARPKPGARDQNGKPINFALVDVDVAPDGSIFISDHNQGVWRLYYGERRPANELIEIGPTKKTPTPPIDQLLSLPQPGAEWSRLREEAIRRQGGPDLESQLRALAVNVRKPLDQRLRAIRLLAPAFAEFPSSFIELLARDRSPEIRGQAAFLLGLHSETESAPMLRKLLRDDDPFVRRRAAEALERVSSPDATDALIERLADSSRTVRYTSMTALAHLPTPLFFDKAVAKRDPQIQMRALVAASMRNELPSQEDSARVIASLLDRRLSAEDQLDFLRLLGLFQKIIEKDTNLKTRVSRHLETTFTVGKTQVGRASPRADFPNEGLAGTLAPPGETRLFDLTEKNIRWEQIRLLGEYKLTSAFSKLLRALEAEQDHPTQFHIAQATARLNSGWTAVEEQRLLKWFVSTQRGWFAEFADKGVEFPQFWMTVLTDFGSHHRAALLQNLSQVDYTSLMGSVTLNLLARESHGAERLISFYRTNSNLQVRLKSLTALATLHDREILTFARTEYPKADRPELKAALLKTLAALSEDKADAHYFFDGLTNRQTDVVRLCANALSRIRPALPESSARAAISRMAENNELCTTLDSLLRSLIAEKPIALQGRLSDSDRAARVHFWRAWYEKHYNKPFESPASSIAEKTNEQLLAFILSADSKGGDRIRGSAVYETLQCHTCHGGGVNPDREGGLFGPDLAGVTRRLSPKEFAESLVYPSKQVPERYKASEITLQDGTVLTGFITDQNDSSVTLAARDQVHRLARSNVRSIQPQSNSLMPDHLLNPLTWEQIKDLIAFLEEGPNRPNPKN